MDSIKTSISQTFDRAKDWLTQQAFYQQLREKWDSLDSESQRSLKLGGAALSFLSVILLTAAYVWSTHSLRADVIEKQALLGQVQSWTDEVRGLRDATQGPAARMMELSGPWNVVIDQLAVESGIDKAALNLASEKAGSVTDTAKETLLEISLKGVSIKQIVGFALKMEANPRVLRLKNLSIQTKEDLTGYLDAIMHVSGYTLQDPNGKK